MFLSIKKTPTRLFAIIKSMEIYFKIYCTRSCTCREKESILHEEGGVKNSLILYMERLRTITGNGVKKYEYTNHGQNVLVTVSDKKLQHSTDGTTIDYYNPDVVTAQDYSSYGAALEGRQYNSASQRYGFNGQMKSPEIGSNNYTAEFWEYNANIGVRWNIDSKGIVGISPYAVLGDNPILHIDPLGDSDVVPIGAQNFALRQNANKTYGFFDQATNQPYNGGNQIMTNLTTTLNGFATSSDPDVSQRFSQMQGDNIVHNINTTLNGTPPVNGVVRNAAGQVTQTNTAFSNITDTRASINGSDERENLISNNGTAAYQAQFGAAFLSTTYVNFTRGGNIQGSGQTANGFFDANGKIQWLDQPTQPKFGAGTGAAQTSINFSDRARIENKILFDLSLSPRKYFIEPLLNAAGTNFASPGTPITLQSVGVFSTNWTPDPHTNAPHY